MSRSTQTEIKEKPCKKFLKWENVRETTEVQGQEVKILKRGEFVFWNRETEQNEVAPLPLEFAVLENDEFPFLSRDDGTTNDF